MRVKCKIFQLGEHVRLLYPNSNLNLRILTWLQNDYINPRIMASKSDLRMRSLILIWDFKPRILTFSLKWKHKLTEEIRPCDTVEEFSSVWCNVRFWSEYNIYSQSAPKHTTLPHWNVSLISSNLCCKHVKVKQYLQSLPLPFLPPLHRITSFSFHPHPPSSLAPLHPPHRSRAT